jgi:23S rRNA (uridine2552-2'-O)-methyltransferase
MSSKGDTRRWLRGHLADPYVREANAKGYRSRAALKLAQLDDAEKLFKRGDSVLDLGSAPGGWSQVAVQRVGERGKVVAIDLLDMPALPGVQFLQGDFTDPDMRAGILELLGSQRVRVVLSDLAPNLTGLKDTDQARASDLAMQVLDFAHGILQPQGRIVIKIFSGGAMEEIVREARRLFRNVKVKKPQASRARSAEVYLLGTGADGVF